VLLIPKWVTTANIESTVIKDKWISVSKLWHPCGGRAPVRRAGIK